MMKSFIFLIVSVSITYLLIGLTVYNYNPYEWNDIWQATWFISSLQIYLFYKLNDWMSK